MRPKFATFENLVESMSLEDQVGDTLRVLDVMYKAGYVLGTSRCHSLVGRLCSENPQHAGKHLEEILGDTRTVISGCGKKASFNPSILCAIKYGSRPMRMRMLKSLLAFMEDEDSFRLVRARYIIGFFRFIFG
ncbi:hypothetical protein QJS10_CPB20g01879 [Acorus calamus]|uniref:Pentatricopeptide repeat-containing protein n=1 Tax=Acorus calamus TaxID=4465 RepID=A0AAV9CE34_ACOCL|nr:hypothetical protein QJS10_CPB20g01879 [Acorus calamus]